MKIKSTAAQQAKAIEILNELHAAGFVELLLSSQVIHAGGPMAGPAKEPEYRMFFLKIIIDNDEVSEDRLATVIAIGAKYGARVRIESIRKNGVEHSRLIVWPMEGEDE